MCRLSFNGLAAAVIVRLRSVPSSGGGCAVGPCVVCMYEAGPVGVAENAAFARTRRPDLGAMQAHAVMGGVAGVGMALRGGFDGGRDAAEEEKIGLRRQ